LSFRICFRAQARGCNRAHRHELHRRTCRIGNTASSPFPCREPTCRPSTRGARFPYSESPQKSSAKTPVDVSPKYISSLPNAALKNVTFLPVQEQSEFEQMLVATDIAHHAAANRLRHRLSLKDGDAALGGLSGGRLGELGQRGRAGDSALGGGGGGGTGERGGAFARLRAC